ncbi:MAG: twin-arginine translocation signal domain-containing protein, partial [Candidatus Marinimicrobia bacterium]|nr:twin-arginine translocation signal domain-containing protein [Candidatus Neomarinimicrobiota bacterium]
MDRRTFLKVSGMGALALALPGCGGTTRQSGKPNIVLINVDDLGWT